MWNKTRQYTLLKKRSTTSQEKSHISRAWIPCTIPFFAFFVSILINVLLFSIVLHDWGQLNRVGRTPYAHLRANIPRAWESRSPYFGENESLADRLWDAISIDNGTVALDDSYVVSEGLPISQRFPWDDSKGLYLLNGYHALHCLKTIRNGVLEFDRGIERSEPTAHLLHCLDALRQDVLCYADDTPRYTGLQPEGRSGTGQIRQCRDWKQLEAWAQAHTACWRYIRPHDPEFDSLERHKFCPDGSPYIARVKEVFGNGAL